LKYYGGDIGRKILYPITLLVTFLHEFGHGIGAVITGGWVEEIQINKDGSGWTRSAGGSRAVTIYFSMLVQRLSDLLNLCSYYW